MNLLEVISLRKENEAKIITKALEDPNFYQELMKNGKAALEEFRGQSLPDNIEVNVIEERPNSITLVLPVISTEELSDNIEICDEALGAASGGLICSAVADASCLCSFI